jgi:hypothetical protein
VILLGRERDYQIPDQYVERTDDQVGVPALHLWVLAEDGDPPGALEGALSAALDELFELAGQVSMQLRQQRDPNAVPDGRVCTEYEIALVERFCDMVSVRHHGVVERAFGRGRLPDREGGGVFDDDVFQN